MIDQTIPPEIEGALYHADCDAYGPSPWRLTQAATALLPRVYSTDNGSHCSAAPWATDVAAFKLRLVDEPKAEGRASIAGFMAEVAEENLAKAEPVPCVDGALYLLRNIKDDATPDVPFELSVVSDHHFWFERGSREIISLRDWPGTVKAYNLQHVPNVDAVDHAGNTSLPYIVTVNGEKLTELRAERDALREELAKVKGELETCRIAVGCGNKNHEQLRGEIAESNAMIADLTQRLGTAKLERDTFADLQEQALSERDKAQAEALNLRADVASLRQSYAERGKELEVEARNYRELKSRAADVIDGLKAEILRLHEERLDRDGQLPSPEGLPF